MVNLNERATLEIVDNTRTRTCREGNYPAMTSSACGADCRQSPAPAALTARRERNSPTASRQWTTALLATHWSLVRRMDGRTDQHSGFRSIDIRHLRYV